VRTQDSAGRGSSVCERETRIERACAHQRAREKEREQKRERKSKREEEVTTNTNYSISVYIQLGLPFMYFNWHLQQPRKTGKTFFQGGVMSRIWAIVIFEIQLRYNCHVSKAWLINGTYCWNYYEINQQSILIPTIMRTWANQHQHLIRLLLGNFRHFPTEIT